MDITKNYQMQSVSYANYTISTNFKRFFNGIPPVGYFFKSYYCNKITNTLKHSFFHKQNWIKKARHYFISLEKIYDSFSCICYNPNSKSIQVIKGSTRVDSPKKYTTWVDPSSESTFNFFFSLLGSSQIVKNVIKK